MSDIERLQAEMRAREAGKLALRLAHEARIARRTKAKRAKAKRLKKPVRRSMKELEAIRLDHRMWDYLRRQKIAVEARRQARCSSPQSCIAPGTYGTYFSTADWAEIYEKSSAYLASRGQ